IGDNPLTDGEGARRLGMPCVLIGRSACAHFATLALMLEGVRLPAQVPADRLMPVCASAPQCSPQPIGSLQRPYRTLLLHAPTQAHEEGRAARAGDAGTVPNRSYLTACPGRY